MIFIFKGIKFQLYNSDIHGVIFVLKSEICPASGVITSGKYHSFTSDGYMDDNQGLMIILDTSYKYYLTIKFSLFSKEFNKNMVKYSYNFYFYVVLFRFVT